MTKVKTCPCYGHPLPPDKVALVLRGRRARMIYEIVRDAGRDGITMRDLTDKLYADRADGGPLYHNTISTVAHQRINPLIAKFGVKLECGSGNHRYRLVPLSEGEGVMT
jgi:hypothetical protein